MPLPTLDLRDLFGPIDVYLFDQLLRGRIAPGMRVFDAGCGSGRNLVYLLRSGYDVFGVDQDEDAVAAVRTLVGALAPSLPRENFRCERIEATSFQDAFAAVVICNAVLHFARDEEQFDAMLDGAWRVLDAGGLFFARLASSIGIESLIVPRGGRRYLLPDGSDRFLVDEEFLAAREARLRGTPLDPLKTTVVARQRAMTTWVLRKS